MLDDENLDIQSYSMSDLIELYQLPTDFNTHDIEATTRNFIKKYNLRERPKYYRFILQANERLMRMVDADGRGDADVGQDGRGGMSSRAHGLSDAGEEEDDGQLHNESGGGAGTSRRRGELSNDRGNQGVTMGLHGGVPASDRMTSVPLTNSTFTYDQNNDFVIRHPSLGTAPTFTTDTVAGQINPVRRRILKKVVLVDTRFRKNYYATKSTDFTTVLPTVIKNAISMKLTSFEFPVSTYVFSADLQTNTFEIVYNSSTYTVTVKPGNYSSQELVTYLNTEVFAAAPYSGNVEAFFDARYGKFTLQLSAGAPVTDTLALDFRLPNNKDRDLKMNMGWILGFHEPTYSGARSYEADAFYDAGGPRYLFVVVDEFKKNMNDYFFGAFEDSLIKTNVLGRIPQLNGVNDILFNDNSDKILKKRDYFGPVNIERLRIQIKDEFDRVIDNNNMDYSLTLEFECVYNL